MGALAYDLPEPLSPRIEEEIQRLQPVDYRVAALLLVPLSVDETGKEGSVDETGREGEGGFCIAFATRQFCDMTGYEGAELVGREMDWLEGPDTEPDALSDLQAALKAAEHAEIDLLAYTKAGVSFWSRLHLQPVMRRDGTVEGFAVYLSLAEKSRASYLSETWQKIEDAWSDKKAWV